MLFIHLLIHIMPIMNVMYTIHERTGHPFDFPPTSQGCETLLECDPETLFIVTEWRCEITPLIFPEPPKGSESLHGYYPEGRFLFL